MLNCFVIFLLFINGYKVNCFLSRNNYNLNSDFSLYVKKYPIGPYTNSYNFLYRKQQRMNNLNLRNLTLQLNEILCDNNNDYEVGLNSIKELLNDIKRNEKSTKKQNKIVIGNFEIDFENNDENDVDFDDFDDDDEDDDDCEIPNDITYYDDDDGYDNDIDDDSEYIFFRKKLNNQKSLLYKNKPPSENKTYKKSDNFEMNVIPSIKFKDVGGYENIKSELNQCIDILSNYSKYAKFNVRVPKGLIFEGPPGNGKTMFAKALSGEANTNFIAVSGSQFQDKYVGVGPARVRELFTFAKENIPCIIFIDEIDALGRKRSSDGEASSGERDNTLNELLISLDGFNNCSGVFLIGATNRADLLDSALIRPGRIDKRIFINNPDKITRASIIDIHIKGKPYHKSIGTDTLVEQTDGFSSAQIENLLNEAMLNALRNNRYEFKSTDVDVVMNKMIAGWQPTEHQFTSALIDQIAIHELGHAVVGVFCKHHSKMSKVVINLSAPRSPAYTIFESTSSSFLTREMLFEHLMILLSGRIAEETFYDVSVTTGAINDFEEALKLAEKMICYYGMGTNVIYPSMSDKYKEMIDLEVSMIINDAYKQAKFIIVNFKDLIKEGAEILKRDNLLTSESLLDLINIKYKHLINKLNIVNPSSRV